MEICPVLLMVLFRRKKSPFWLCSGKRPASGFAIVSRNNWRNRFSLYRVDQGVIVFLCLKYRYILYYCYYISWQRFNQNWFTKFHYYFFKSLTLLFLEKTRPFSNAEIIKLPEKWQKIDIYWSIKFLFSSTHTHTHTHKEIYFLINLNFITVTSFAIS